MMILKGKVLTCNPDKLPGRDGKPDVQIQNVQILSIGKKAVVHDVKDYTLRKFKVGEDVEVPIVAKAFSFKNGGAGLSLSIYAD